jgi:hypothetical protein
VPPPAFVCRSCRQRGAGFDADQTRRQLLKERQNIPTFYLEANDHLAIRIDAVNVALHLRVRHALTNKPQDLTLAIIQVVRSAVELEACVAGATAAIEDRKVRVKIKRQYAAATLRMIRNRDSITPFSGNAPAACIAGSQVSSFRARHRAASVAEGHGCGYCKPGYCKPQESLRQRRLKLTPSLVAQASNSS